MTAAPPLVLASASTTRLRVLRSAGFDPEVIASGIDETLASGLSPAAAALDLAERKVAAVQARCPDRLVLGCDSILELAGEALGKPSTPAEALAMCRRLLRREATLHTGHCLLDTRDGRRLSRLASAAVRIGDAGDDEIAAYVAGGEPLTMAGGFSIDGFGAVFVDGIDGDPSNVLGLSLPLFRRMLAELGIPLIAVWHPAVAPPA